MQYIGVDIIEIDRIEQAVARWGDNFLQRVYTQTELKLYEKHTASLATRFAGKEAVIKALGTPLDRGFTWQDVEILSEPSGKPVVHLYGKAKRLARRLGLGSITVSLSHSKDYAIALAAGEKLDKPNTRGSK